MSAGTACPDGDLCNGDETCDGAGACVAGTPPVVDDGNVCTADSCDPGTGVAHSPVAAGTSCADSNICNGDEACDGAGTCAAGAPLPTDDGNACTTDACDPVTGVSHTPVSAGTSCSDGNACNGGETCDAAGTCLAGTAPDIDDFNPCTADSCDAGSGVVHAPVAAGSSCSDGAFCNGDELCDGAGACQAGTPVDVDDGDPCTVDSCGEVQGITHAAAPAGTACPDADVCNGTETCDGSGACIAGTPLTVGSSSNPCVVQVTCDPVSGLAFDFEPFGTACGEGFICDGNGSCLRDQGGGTLPPPLPPGATNGITTYGPGLPRDTVNGCTLEAINPDHVAVIAGTVKTWDATQQQYVAVPEARVSITGRCELGAARTLSDGTFRFPVNGGERYVVRVEADADGDGTFDYLPVERAVETKWRASAGMDDVVLVLPAPVSEMLALTNSAVPQDIVVNGPPTEDDRDGDGIAAERTPSVLFKAGTGIAGVDANGATVELDAAAIRMTEYTVGSQGLQQMPAPMPPGTAYGYAVELSIDGVESAYFDQPVVLYVDNFIGAEAARSGIVSEPHQVGLPVPAWYYDRNLQAWVPQEDGIIIRLVGVDASSPPQALIDVDDDGDADQDDEDYLVAQNVIMDVAEREQLAAEILAGRRSVDDELWRIEIQHFSTFDWNWVLHCGDACLAGDLLNDPTLGGTAGPANCKRGSMVHVEPMSLSESFDVGGTPFSLNYSSRAMYGYQPRRQRRVDRSLPVLPFPLSIAGISETLQIGGKRMHPEGCEIHASGLQCHEYDGFFTTPETINWDGRDADGRIAYGTHRGGWTVVTTVQAQAGNDVFIRDFFNGFRLQMTVYDAKILGLGGWTLSPHHFYDAEGNVLFRGDGGESTSRAETVDLVHDTGSDPTNRPMQGTRVLGDGSVFFANDHEVQQLRPDGQVVTWSTLFDQVFAPNGPERLYIANASTSTSTPHRIRRLELIGGNVQETTTVDQSVRTEALTIGPDNLLYALLATNPISVHRYTLDLQHADGGEAYFTLPGSSSASNTSQMVFYGETLYLAVGNAGGIFRFGPDDDIPVRIANSGGSIATLSEGQLALSLTSNNNTNYTSLRVTEEGVFFARTADQSRALWLIDHDGFLRRVAGDAAAAVGSGDGGPAIFAGFGSDFSFDVAPDESIFVYERFPTGRLRRIHPPGPEGLSAQEASVPSEDGTLVYDFDLDGHHLRTRTVATGDVLYSFEYDDGLLSAIVHGDKDAAGGSSLPRTRILRDIGGQVTIEAPSGQQTRIVIDPDTGYATDIFDAAGGHVSLMHDAEGLLRQMIDQRGFVHTYDYDSMGRLISDTSPGLQAQTLTGWPLMSVAHTNGESEQSQYNVNLDQDTGELTRTVTNSDGSSMTLALDKKLNRAQTFSDGTSIDETFVRHPLFSTAAPVLASRTTHLPSGLTRAETHSLAQSGDVWTETFGLNGNVATTQTDQVQKTTTTVTAQGRTATTVLDERSRPVQVQVGSLEPRQFVYDAQDRLLSVTAGTGPSARTTNFDYYPDGTGLPESGHLMTVTDATGQALDFTRDAFGRALSATADNDTTEFGYDPSGDLARLTTANDDTHLQFFNGVNLLTHYVAPASAGTDSLTQYAYDNTRRLTTTTLPGSITVTQTRDGADPEHPERKGRLRSISSPNNGNGTSPFEIGYAYADEVTCPEPPDPCPPGGPPGQLSAMTRDDINTVLSWDGFIPVAETHIIEPGSSTGLVDTEYSITLNTNFEPQNDAVVTGSSSLTARYNYDNDAVLICAGHGTSCGTSNGVSYAFDSGAGDAQPAGHGLLEGTTSGAIAEAFTYNGFGELATHQLSVNGQPIITTTYDDTSAPRDALGRIVTKATTRASGTSAITYGYDAKGQLLTVTPDGGPTRTNKYDPNGNRLCTFEAPATDCAEEAVYDAQDRLRSFGDTDYLYTDRGSLFQRDDGQTLETFSYDALGNLTRVQRTGAPTIDYLVDAQNHRVGKQLSGTLQKQYLWSSTLRIAAELDGTGNVTSRFIYGHKVNVPALIVQPDPGGDKLYRVITDQLGSPTYVVNVANPADVLLDAKYDEWGKVTAYTSSTGAWPIPFGFAGGLYDEDTGLVRFGARDYDPTVGRWTNKDPIRWEGGQANLYVYVGNDPVTLQDFTGRNPFLVGGVIGGVAGAFSYALTASTSLSAGQFARGFVGAIASGAISGATLTGGPGLALAGGIAGSAVGDVIAGNSVSLEGATISGIVNVLGAATIKSAVAPFARDGILASQGVREVARSLEIDALIGGFFSGTFQGALKNEALGFLNECSNTIGRP